MSQAKQIRSVGECATSKGSSITLVDDSAAPHIIANGSWMNGSPQPMQESGMPAVNNLQVTNNGGESDHRAIQYAWDLPPDIVPCIQA